MTPKPFLRLAGVSALSFILSFQAASARKAEVSSPSGKIVLSISDEGAAPSWEVSLSGRKVIEPCALGLDTDLWKSEGASIGEVKYSFWSDSYDIATTKKSHVEVSAKEMTVSFTKDGVTLFDVQARVSDTWVAFRYLLPPQGETLCCVVTSELTTFRFPEDATSFICPQMEPMGGWKRSAPSYETHYEADAPLGGNGLGYGYTFPCLFRIGDRGWALVSETGVDGYWCASHIEGGNGTSYKIAFPDEKEMNGLASSTPGVRLPGVSPWRTVVVAEDLAPIVESTVATDLVAPKYEPSREYGGSKGTWSWIMAGGQPHHLRHAGILH